MNITNYQLCFVLLVSSTLSSAMENAENQLVEHTIFETKDNNEWQHASWNTEPATSAAVLFPNYLMARLRDEKEIDSCDASLSPAWKAVTSSADRWIGDQLVQNNIETTNSDGVQGQAAAFIDNVIQTWAVHGKYNSEFKKGHAFYTGTQPKDTRQYCCTFSPDGRELLYSRCDGNNNVTLIFDANSGHLKKRYKQGYNYVDYKGVMGLTVDYGHDNKTNASSYTLENGDPVCEKFTIPSNNVSASPDCRQLASFVKNTEGNIEQITIYQTETGQQRHAISFYPDKIDNTAWSRFSSQGERLAVICNSLIRIYQTKDAAHLHNISDPSRNFADIHMVDIRPYLILTLANNQTTKKKTETNDESSQITAYYPRGYEKEMNQLLCFTPKEQNNSGKCTIQ